MRGPPRCARRPPPVSRREPSRSLPNGPRRTASTPRSTARPNTRGRPAGWQTTRTSRPRPGVLQPARGTPGHGGAGPGRGDLAIWPVVPQLGGRHRLANGEPRLLHAPGHGGDASPRDGPRTRTRAHHARTGLLLAACAYGCGKAPPRSAQRSARTLKKLASIGDQLIPSRTWPGSGRQTRPGPACLRTERALRGPSPQHLRTGSIRALVGRMARGQPVDAALRGRPMTRSPRSTRHGGHGSRVRPCGCNRS